MTGLPRTLGSPSPGGGKKAAPQVNADWNATDGVAVILNKPPLGSAAAQDSSAFLQPSAIGSTVQAFSTTLQNTTASFTTALLSKLNSVADGAEVNVNADWNAGSGDAQILNKPALGSASSKDTGTSAGNVPVLDGSGKLVTSILPEAVLGALKYQGPWNANTNSPAIPTASSANLGWYRVVTTAGTTPISGVSDWQVGDWIVSNGTSWDKIDSSDQVNSVAGLMGTITAPNLRIALSLVVGTDVQAYDAELAALAGLTSGANLLPYFTGSGTAGTATFTAAARTFTALTPSTTGNVATWNGSAWVAQAPASAAVPTLIVRDEQATSTPGATPSGSSAFDVRTLNTVDRNTISGASLASNVITLPAGTYEVEGSANAYTVGTHKCRLWNITDSTSLLIGSSERSVSTGGTGTRSMLLGSFTIAATKTIRLEHACQTSASSGYGFAAGAGVTEVYAQLMFKKVA